MQGRPGDDHGDGRPTGSPAVIQRVATPRSLRGKRCGRGRGSGGYGGSGCARSRRLVAADRHPAGFRRRRVIRVVLVLFIVVLALPVSLLLAIVAAFVVLLAIAAIIVAIDVAIGVFIVRAVRGTRTRTCHGIVIQL